MVTSKTDYSTGVKKHVRDSVRYFYSNPSDHLLQTGGCSPQGADESETWRKLKVKVQGQLLLSEVPSGSKELGDQIARLMAALTRAEQSSCTLPVPPAAQGHRDHGRGWTDRNTPVHPKAPTMVGLAWAKPPLSTAPL